VAEAALETGFFGGTISSISLSSSVVSPVLSALYALGLLKAYCPLCCLDATASLCFSASSSNPLLISLRALLTNLASLAPGVPDALSRVTNEEVL